MMRILIAEDDPKFRQLLEQMLARWGYEVLAAKDGNEAWQAMSSDNAPRLAILDWLMPGMDGVEVCRRIRKERPEPYTYIMFLTSQKRDEDLIVGMEAGADDYITKPLKANELRVRLNAAVRVIELQKELAANASELEAANRDLESFSYTVIEDLLTSLLSIGENAKSIEDLYCRNQDEQCKAYTHRIYEKTRHLAEFVRIMHDFFKPSRGELHRETVDLSAVVGTLVKKLRVAVPHGRVTFRIAEGVTAHGDKGMLEVALKNLLANAIKHTSSREDGVVEFGVTDIGKKPAYFIRDNGIGFDMAHAEKLFKPFQRLPGTEEFAGSGIGLATVERIVRRHGGKAWAEGAPGEGATFYFTLSPE